METVIIITSLGSSFCTRVMMPAFLYGHHSLEGEGEVSQVSVEDTHGARVPLCATETRCRITPPSSWVFGDRWRGGGGIAMGKGAWSGLFCYLSWNHHTSPSCGHTLVEIMKNNLTAVCVFITWYIVLARKTPCIP